MPMSRSYFISTTPRTGSFLLAHALDSTGIAGRPQEYFDPNFEKDWCVAWASADAEYFEKVLPAGTTPNGVFAAKVHWHQFVHLREASARPGRRRADLDLWDAHSPTCGTSS